MKKIILKSFFFGAWALGQFETGQAFPLDSTYAVSKVPGLMALGEAVTFTPARCPKLWLKVRSLKVQIEGREDTLTTHLASSFVDKDGDNYQCQSQLPTITTNKQFTRLHYFEESANLELEAGEHFSPALIQRIRPFLAPGPVLIMDGGTAWERFDAMPTKSPVKISSSQAIAETFEVASLGGDLCFRRVVNYGHYAHGGSDQVFCALPLPSKNK